MNVPVDKANIQILLDNTIKVNPKDFHRCYRGKHLDLYTKQLNPVRSIEDDVDAAK